MEGAPFISAFFIGDLSSSGKYSTQGWLVKQQQQQVYFKLSIAYKACARN